MRAARVGDEIMFKKKRPEAELLVLHPQPSLRLRWALLGGQSLALAALWLAALPWWLAALGSGGLIILAWLSWRKPLPVRELQWGRDSLWQLGISQGVWVDARLDTQGSRSWPWWVYLDFRLDDGRRLGVTLAVDSLNKDAFRRLRSRLKVEAGALLRDGDAA